MSKPVRFSWRWLYACLGLALLVVAPKVGRVLSDHHENVVVAGGPFGTRFPELYPATPEMGKAIERWFDEVIPVGTDREKAREVLSRSFTADLTSGG